MGMGVFGKAPTTKEGKYFRNNVWWWRPLAGYCQQIAPEVCKACQHWQSNDGDGLDAEGAQALADALELELESGRTQAYAEAYAAERAALPRHPCEYCEATGTTTEAVALKYPAYFPHVGKTCIQCKGLGTREDSATHYPFDVDNVREFVTFLRGCGGFEIC